MNAQSGRREGIEASRRVVNFIGDNEVKFITRLMGLIAVVIGVQDLIHRIGGAVSAYADG